MWFVDEGQIRSVSKPGQSLLEEGVSGAFDRRAMGAEHQHNAPVGVEAKASVDVD
jgi:hypothetical protein